MVTIRFSASLVSNGQINKQIMHRNQELTFEYGNNEVAFCIEKLVSLIGGLNG